MATNVTLEQKGILELQKLNEKLQKQLEADIWKLYENKTFSDFELSARSKTVKSHRCILKARAPDLYVELVDTKINNSALDVIEDFLSDIYLSSEVKKKEEDVLKYIRKVNHINHYNEITTHSNCKAGYDDLNLTREVHPTTVYYCLVYSDSDDHLLSADLDPKKHKDYSANDNIIDNYFLSMEYTKNGEIHPCTQVNPQNLPTAHDTLKLCEKNGCDGFSEFDLNLNESNNGEGNDNSYLQDSGLEMNCDENDSIISKTLTIHSDAFEEQASERSTSISSAFSKTDKTMEENISRQSLDINDSEWLNDECSTCDDAQLAPIFSGINNGENANVPSVTASNDKFTYFIDAASLFDENECASNWGVTLTNDLEHNKNNETKYTDLLGTSNDTTLLNKNEKTNPENGMEFLCDPIAQNVLDKPILDQLNNNYNADNITVINDKDTQHFIEADDKPILNINNVNNVCHTEINERQSKSLFPMFIDIRQTESSNENSHTYKNGHTENIEKNITEDIKRPSKKQGFYMFIDLANDKNECEITKDSLTVTPEKSNDKWMEQDVTKSKIPDVFVSPEFPRISENAEPVRKSNNVINGKFENGLHKEEIPPLRNDSNKYKREGWVNDIGEEDDRKLGRESPKAMVDLDIEIQSKNSKKNYYDNKLQVDSQDKVTPVVVSVENTCKNKYETDYKHSASDQSLSLTNKVITEDVQLNRNKSQSFVFDFSNNQMDKPKDFALTECNTSVVDKRIEDEEHHLSISTNKNITNQKHPIDSNFETVVSSSVIRESECTPDTPDSLNNFKVSDNFNFNSFDCKTSMNTEYHNMIVDSSEKDITKVSDASNVNQKLLDLSADKFKVSDAKLPNNQLNLKMTDVVNNRAATAESWTVSFDNDTSKTFGNHSMMKCRNPSSVVEQKGNHKKLTVKKDMVKKHNASIGANIDAAKQLQKKECTEEKVNDEVCKEHEKESLSSANSQLFTMFIDVASESEGSINKSDPFPLKSSVKIMDKTKNSLALQDRSVFRRPVSSVRANSGTIKSNSIMKTGKGIKLEKDFPSNVTKTGVTTSQKTVDLKIEEQVKDDSPVENNFVKLSDMDKIPSKLIIQEKAHMQDRMFRSIPDMSWFESKVLSGSLNSRSLSRIFPHLTASVLSRTSSDTDCRAASISSSMYSSIGTQNMDCNFTTSLGADLLRMFLEEISPDVVIEVAGRRIKAHKCILSSRCQYFAAKLSGGWVQSAGNVISFPGYSYSIVHFALCHIYSGVSILPDDIDITELTKFTDYICLEGLKEVITYKLKIQYCHFFHKPCSVCTSGVLECLPLAAQYNLDEIYTKSIQWINKYYVKLWPNEGFLSLSSDLLDRCLRFQLHQISVDNILDTLMNCDKMLTMMYGIRWAKVISIIKRLHDETIKYAAENFQALLESDSSLAVDRVWNISVMENKVELISKKMSVDQLCSSYSAINRAKKVIPVQSQGSNEDFIKLLCIVKNVLEQRLVKDASKALKCNSWYEMDNDLRRKIQSLSGIILIRNISTKPNNLNTKTKETRGRQTIDTKMKPLSQMELSHKKELEGKLNVIKKKEERKKDIKVANIGRGSITRSSSEPVKMHSVPNSATTSISKKYVDVKPRYLLPKKAVEDGVDIKKKNTVEVSNTKTNVLKRGLNNPSRGNVHISRKESSDRNYPNKRTPCKPVASGSKEKTKPIVPAPLSRSGTFSKEKPTILKPLTSK